MEIYDIDPKPVNSDFLRTFVKKGQKVRIVRMLTISYELEVTDEWLEEYGSDEPGMSVETLIEDDNDNDDISVNVDWADETDIDDNIVIAVEII